MIVCLTDLVQPLNDCVCALCDNGELKKGNEFKKLLSKFDFQKLNKILISQVCFFNSYVIVFRSPKMLAQTTDLRLCAFMSLSLYVPVLLRLRHYVQGSFVCALMS